jgi:hypothetical protein
MRLDARNVRPKAGRPRHLKTQDNAIDLFLEALCAWGPLSSLRERLKLHRTSRDIESPQSQGKEAAQTRLFNEAETFFLLG